MRAPFYSNAKQMGRSAARLSTPLFLNPILLKSKISRLWPSVIVQPGLCRTSSETTQTVFLTSCADLCIQRCLHVHFIKLFHRDSFCPLDKMSFTRSYMGFFSTRLDKPFTCSFHRLNKESWNRFLVLIMSVLDHRLVQFHKSLHSEY